MNEKITQLIARHEAFKQKWLMLNNDDLFNWVMLQDEMISLSSNLKSEYNENEIRLKVEKGKRMIELKTLLDDNGKKLHTESTADWTLRAEFLDKDIQQNALKTSYELLYQTAQLITEYINIIKLNNKALFTI